MSITLRGTSTSSFDNISVKNCAAVNRISNTRATDAPVVCAPKLFAVKVEDSAVGGDGTSRDVLAVTRAEIAAAGRDLQQLVAFVSGPLGGLQRRALVEPLRQQLYQAIQSTHAREEEEEEEELEDRETEMDRAGGHGEEEPGDEDSTSRVTGVWCLTENLVTAVVSVVHERAVLLRGRAQIGTITVHVQSHGSASVSVTKSLSLCFSV